MKLSQFVMTPGAVHDYLNAIETIVHVGVLRDPELLTGLTGNGRIIALKDGVSKFRGFLTNDRGDLRSQVEVFNGSSIVSDPGGKPATFSIVVASGQV